MPATPLDEAVKDVLFRKLEVTIVATIADLDHPTRTELDAGTDVTAQLDTIAGFTKTQNYNDANRVGAALTGRVKARQSVGDCSLTFYEDDGNDIREVIEEDDFVNVCFFRNGDVAAKKYDVWPMQVGVISKSTDVNGNKMLTVSFGIAKTPRENLTVPAHAA